MVVESEKDLLLKLEAAEAEIKQIRSKINSLRSSLWDQESSLLTAQLLKEKLVRDLKETREQTYDPEDVVRNEDIERFKKVLPDLMEKEKKKEQ